MQMQEDSYCPQHPDELPPWHAMRHYVVRSGTGRWVVRATNSLHAVEKVMRFWPIMAGSAHPMPYSDVVQVAETAEHAF